MVINVEKPCCLTSFSFYSFLFEAAVGRVGLAGVDVNNEDNRIADLVLNTIVVNKQYPHVREICEAAYLGKSGKQLYLPVNHAEKLLAIFVIAIALIKIVQDGFKTVGKLWAVNNL